MTTIQELRSIANITTFQVQSIIVEKCQKMKVISGHANFTRQRYKRSNPKLNKLKEETNTVAHTNVSRDGLRFDLTGHFVKVT